MVCKFVERCVSMSLTEEEFNDKCLSFSSYEDCKAYGVNSSRYPKFWFETITKKPKPQADPNIIERGVC